MGSLESQGFDGFKRYFYGKEIMVEQCFLCRGLEWVQAAGQGGNGEEQDKEGV